MIIHPKPSSYRFPAAAMLFILLSLNQFFLGIGFWKQTLDAFLQILILLPFAIIVFGTIKCPQKNKWLRKFELLISIGGSFILLSQFLFHQFHSPYALVDTMTLQPNKKSVEVYADNEMKTYLFVEKKHFLKLFARKECVYWAEAARPDSIEWSKKDENNLMVQGYLKGSNLQLINLENTSGNACSCHNEVNVSLSRCSLQSIIEFWIELPIKLMETQDRINEYQNLKTSI